MRIVCPNCGEEPVKGQRHVCAVAKAPVASIPGLAPAPLSAPGGGMEGATPSASSGGGIQRRGAAHVASSGAVCASIASLVTKNPSLWRSGKALARCGGEDFVAGLLAAAAGSVGWHRDPKTVLMTILSGSVQQEAARALQDFWRVWSGARKRPPRYAQGYRQLELTHTAASQPHRAAPARPPALLPVGSMGEHGASRARAGSGGQALHRDGTMTPPVPPSPRQPGTPRNRSNPRPVAVRAVPMNPIQAMKHRKNQQQLDVEERKLKEAMEETAAIMGAARLPAGPPSMAPPCGQLALAAMPADGADEAYGSSRPGAWSNPPSAPSSPRRRMPLPPTLPGEDLAAAALTPLERRAMRKASADASVEPPSPTSSGMCDSPRSRALVPASPTRRGGGGFGHQVSSAPPTLTGWRPPSAGRVRDEPPRPSSQQSPSATDRLKERMKQREGGSVGRREPSVGASGGAADWRSRIEARQREAEEVQVQEHHNKQQNQERSGKRNDAMRRVMERQAQRQHEVDALEA